MYVSFGNKRNGTTTNVKYGSNLMSLGMAPAFSKKIVS